MPVMDGLQATKEIRKLGYTNKIFALSAQVMNKDGERLAAGMDASFTKPIHISEVMLEIAKIVVEQETQHNVDCVA
jgi:CheY-like chemotaxis protein